MGYFAGLDVATEETSICVVNGEGAIAFEATVATEPGTICKSLRKHLPRLRRVGHEAGSM
jgi:transposase